MSEGRNYRVGDLVQVILPGNISFWALVGRVSTKSLHFTPGGWAHFHDIVARVKVRKVSIRVDLAKAPGKDGQARPRGNGG